MTPHVYTSLLLPRGGPSPVSPATPSQRQRPAAVRRSQPVTGSGYPRALHPGHPPLAPPRRPPPARPSTLVTSETRAVSINTPRGLHTPGPRVAHPHPDPCPPGGSPSGPELGASRARLPPRPPPRGSSVPVPHAARPLWAAPGPLPQTPNPHATPQGPRHSGTPHPCPEALPVSTRVLGLCRVLLLLSGRPPGPGPRAARPGPRCPPPVGAPA